jgi:hypothetical protein
LKAILLNLFSVVSLFFKVYGLSEFCNRLSAVLWPALAVNSSSGSTKPGKTTKRLQQRYGDYRAQNIPRTAGQDAGRCDPNQTELS